MTSARTSAAALTLCLAFSSSRGAAQVAPDCATAYAMGQDHRLAGRLFDARTAFQSCAATSCAPALAADCARWAREVEADLPTVRLHVTGAEGQRIAGLRAFADGVALVGDLARPIVLEAGPHDLRFEAPGYAPVEAPAALRPTDRELEIKVVLYPPGAAPEPHAAAQRSAPPLSLVLAGVGVVSLGTAAYFGFAARSQFHDLEARCAPRCSRADSRAVKSKALVADIAWVTSLAALGAAAWILLGPSRKSPCGAGRCDHPAGWSGGRALRVLKAEPIDARVATNRNRFRLFHPKSTTRRCFQIGGVGAALALLGPASAQAQLRDTLSDTWEATDGLGRSLPDGAAVGAPNQRAVLIFYYFWHQRNDSPAPYDISKIIAGKQQPFADATFGPAPAFHHWGEPALGYYDINDEFVLRRHAQMLSDAGVDAVVLDVTNAATYDNTWRKLCSVYADLRAHGNRTPLVSFIANSSSDATVQHLYDVLYSKNECAGLLYQYQGKPLMMAARGAGLSAAAKDFFTFRHSWAWTDPNGWFEDGKDKWPWLDNFPQKWGWHDSAGVPEEMPVGVAQHPTGNYGRSHHAGKQPALDADYNTPDTAKGLGFQEQWDQALAKKPTTVFVTQWNEWIAQRFVKCGTYTTSASQFLGKPLACNDTHFIDDFNQEFSRDVEPMRGGHEDAYYYQLAANVRRFKGARPAPVATPAKHITALSAQSFDDVGPRYLDDVGDVTHRSALGYAGPQKYENASGRNDFESLRVARDDISLFFYAKTQAPLSPRTDPLWMVLWLDTDADASTGCGGFDYAVNRSRTGDVASVEHCVAAAWQRVADAELAASGSDLVLAVPRAALQLPASAGALSVRFKWTDNVPEPLQALDLLQLGDTAPNGRFTYRYSASVDLAPRQPPGSAGAGGVAGSGGAAGGGGGQSNAGTGGGGRSRGAGGSVVGGSGDAPAAVDDSGCSCRVVVSSSRRGGGTAAALALGLLLFARRRR